MRNISTLALTRAVTGLLLVSTLGGATAYAASTVAKNRLLDEQEAENFAFMDADVNADEVTNLRTYLEKDAGIYVYDIEFYVGNIEYDYEIRAEDGMVLEKGREDKSRRVKKNDADNSDDGASSEADYRKEGITAGSAAQIGGDASVAVKGQEDADGPSAAGASTDKAEPAAGNKYISVDRAKQIALEDAGLNEEEVKLTTAKFEDDDGAKEYEIEFYSGKLEYEYEIDAVTGEILESEVEAADD